MTSHSISIFSMVDTNSTSISETPSEVLSVFGDGSCGEPLKTHQLLIDFTQTEEDSDFVQKKCCDFWEFIQSQPELQNMMVSPEPNAKLKSFSSSSTSSTVPEIVHEPVDTQRTAVSMLAFTEEKGLIDRTFEAKLPYTTCSLGSREYHENESSGLTEKLAAKPVCSCAGTCETCFTRFSVPPESAPDVVKLSKKMEQWDEKHPKVFDEPGHPPALSYCIMQRKPV